MVSSFLGFTACHANKPVAPRARLFLAMEFSVSCHAHLEECLQSPDLTVSSRQGGCFGKSQVEDDSL